MTARGSYAKGVAKREEILTKALGVIARNGYRKTSVRELADAVGLSQAGVLHYFASKEELFGAVLRKRDEVDLATFESFSDRPIDALTDLIRHNADVPGLVQLYAQITVEAADPDHPAHDYFIERQRQFRAHFGDFVRAEQAAGRIDASRDADRVAVLFFAATDGLQTLWMLDPTIDMAEHVSELWRSVSAPLP